MNPHELDTKRLLRLAHANGIRHGAMNFWVGMLSNVLDPVGPTTRILEFGSTGSEFFRLLCLAFEYREAIGVLLTVDGPDHSHEWPRPSGPECRFVSEDIISTIAPQVDIAFSQEVFSLVPDLTLHAKLVHSLLAPEGVYYATLGWHLDNPATTRFAASRAAAGKPFHGHHLADITDAFQEAGFEVGFKRLPVPYFLIHDRAIVASRFGSIPGMIDALHDWKILFQFRKGSVR